MRRLLLSSVLLVSCSGEPNGTSIEAVAHHHHDRAEVHLHDTDAKLVQTSETSWGFAKTGSVDNTHHTVAWTITAIRGTTETGHLIVDGYMNVTNDGDADATIGNIVVNLQTKAHHHDHDQDDNHGWTTVSSDIADATQDDNATSAHVVAHACSDNVEIFNENGASGHVVFMDATNNTVFSLVPEKTVPAKSSVALLFSASFDNNVLGLAVGTKARTEVIVTFGNSGYGDSAQDVDINGNGVIDADEDYVRSVAAHHKVNVPQATHVNADPTITDTTFDLAVTGTVSLSNPVFNIGSTSGHVSVSFDGGASGGTVTNCAHLDAPDTVSHLGGFTFNDLDGIHLTACNTEAIQATACTPGTPGCGWQDGDLVTYTQGSWGGNPGVDAGATLLVSDFNTIYGSAGGVIVGSASGFTMVFTDANSVLTYQPSIGPFGALNGSVVNPLSTASGAFGGEVLGLTFNVDFSDAGALHGSAGVEFGNLTLCGLTGAQATLDNRSVRDFLSIENTLLSGGSSVIAISDLGTLASDVNGAFSNGTPSTFAQLHLVNGPCP